MLTQLGKLEVGLKQAGPVATAWGIVRWLYIKAHLLRNPGNAVQVVLNNDLKIAFYRHQIPTVLLVFGGYIDPEYDYLRGRIRPDWTVVDVGAGIGQFTLFAAKEGAQVRAYEPNHVNLASLLMNLQVNGFMQRVTWNAYGLAAAPGPVPFRNDGLNSTIANKGAKGSISCSTLDDEIAPGELIDLLKVNVAGAECAVLLGAERVFKTRQIGMLVVLLSHDVIPLLREIEMCGYRFFFWDPALQRRRYVPVDEGILHHPARHILAERP